MYRGSTAPRSFRCVDALGALGGHIGVPGGGVSHGYNTQRHFDKTVEAADRARHHRAIRSPCSGAGSSRRRSRPFRMMFVNGGNPVNQSPNSNLVARASRVLDSWSW